MKKEERMLSSFGMLDDCFVEEAAPSKQVKVTRLVKLAAFAACISLLVGISTWLFIPYGSMTLGLAKYESSEYYAVIEKLEALTARNSENYNNRFDKLFSNLQSLLENIDFRDSDGDLNVPTSGADDWLEYEGDADPSNYEEVTDNQVAGVVEADIIKRSDKYIYYLNGEYLRIYSIEREESKEISSYKIELPKDAMYVFSDDMEFYLSEDCRTVTLLYPYTTKNKEARIAISSIDVSDPQQPSSVELATVAGSYVSSRVTNGEILLISSYYCDSDQIDYSDPSTFIPSMNLGEGDECIPMDSIILPDEITSSRYTVVCKLNENTLALGGAVAFLSYSDEVYVSSSSIYVTRGYSKIETSGKLSTVMSMTDISRLSYTENSLSYMGTVSVEGYVKDRYSLDEYKGILRAVTTTSKSTYTVSKGRRDSISADLSPDILESNGTSASIYCIDLLTNQIVVEVKNFAPRGETVRSVRFDKTEAYVCTAVEVTDPVFFFDLSDMNNITYTDTGNIKGFSTSLVNLGDGLLLGIGVGGDTDTVKVEVYEELSDSVISLDSYEIRGYYAEDYKAYLVDREASLFGFGIESYDGYKDVKTKYILLYFNGYKLYELVNTELDGMPADMRAVYIDGYLYMIAEEFKVLKLHEQ